VSGEAEKKPLESLKRSVERKNIDSSKRDAVRLDNRRKGSRSWRRKPSEELSRFPRGRGREVYKKGGFMDVPHP